MVCFVSDDEATTQLTMQRRNDATLRRFFLLCMAGCGGLLFDFGGTVINPAIPYLESLGMTVLRIPNDQIWKNLRGVCEAIDEAVARPLHQP